MASKRTVKASSASASSASKASKVGGKSAASKPKPGKFAAGRSAPAKPGAEKNVLASGPGKSPANKPAVVKPTPKTAPAKPAAVNPDADPELGPIPEADLRKVKTGMTKKDYDHYRQLLLEKRSEILGDVASLQTDQRNNTGGNLSNMPLHMADVGSDHYEQEFTLGLVESERKLLHEIDEALRRMRRGIYGVCLEKGEPIGKPRLDAKPWAKYCIAVAREMERRGKTG